MSAMQLPCKTAIALKALLQNIMQMSLDNSNLDSLEESDGNKVDTWTGESEPEGSDVDTSNIEITTEQLTKVIMK